MSVTDRLSGRLVGFARVLTDRTQLALILDVVAAPDVRGVGIAAMIMDAVLAHRWVSRVRSVELVCQSDLVGFTDEVGQSASCAGLLDPDRSPGPALGSASDVGGEVFAGQC
ncbi:GNAT family N-acetyltransferase [Actinoplanes sp. NPDC048967]|uniref:GNAT family N-acetyltransferase n=1 Tax=Actinoplanes sp. NPDC048967 TaxID=3155269 RepID=UPI0033FD8495